MVTDATFKAFRAAYPPVVGQTQPIDGVSLAEEIGGQFGILVPEALQMFWLRIGAGAFGRGEIRLFGNKASNLPGPEIISWNRGSWWRSVCATPAKGGPFFFGQTPFGDQLGFRWQDGVALPELLRPDTMEVFLLGRDVDELLHELLGTPGALCDLERLARATRQCPLVPPGYHLVPDVSPLDGGMDDSFHVEPPEVHLGRAAEKWNAIRKRIRASGAVSARR